jgi:hypothetical protein
MSLPRMPFASTPALNPALNAFSAINAPGPSNYAAIPPPVSLSVPPPMTTSKPLFPAASSMVAGSSSSQGNPFSGQAGGSSIAPPVAAPAVIAKPASVIGTVGANSRIVHPDEDISLEELRMRLPKYKHLLQPPPVAQVPVGFMPMQPPPFGPPPGSSFNHGHSVSQPMFSTPSGPPHGLGHPLQGFSQPPPQFQSTFRPAY